VVAVETFLADVAQHVAGDRVSVTALLPLGVDPHSFEPTPADAARVVASNVLIVNGAGLEAFLDRLLANVGGQHQAIVASAGLTSRQPREGEPAPDEPTGDPHFWLDPNNVIKYVQNIRDGLSQADPPGGAVYAANAEAYISQLKELERWIGEQVNQLPREHRLLVTNHESLGYFADRYGFRVVGSIIPSVSSEASPSAQQLAQLVDRIRASGARAIFLETGSNPQLAEQIAQETGVKVVTDLYTHSISAADGPAPSYVEMMRYDVRQIVEALK
jgi:ABC-type Zn uptake system ZnuABC Zn-binding protein ZnuA